MTACRVVPRARGFFNPKLRTLIPEQSRSDQSIVAPPSTTDFAVLFVPIALGTHHLYEWAYDDVVAKDPVLQAKSAYLNVPFFLVRAVFYFVVWSLVASLLRRWSLEQDRDGDPKVTLRMELMSRGGLVLYGLTVTFAVIDWVMRVVTGPPARCG